MSEEYCPDCGKGPYKRLATHKRYCKGKSLIEVADKAVLEERASRLQKVKDEAEKIREKETNPPKKLGFFQRIKARFSRSG